jgi:hypothetical protein
MTRNLSLLFAVIVFFTISSAQSQKQDAEISRSARKAYYPAVTVVKQPSSPVTLKLTSIKAMPDRPGMVKMTFKAEGAPTVKGYHFHYEEVFVDEHGAKGSVMTESTSLRVVPYEESLIARENSKVEIWVSEVEYKDGARWKSPLVPKLMKEGK